MGREISNTRGIEEVARGVEEGYQIVARVPLLSLHIRGYQAFTATVAPTYTTRQWVVPVYELYKFPVA